LRKRRFDALSIAAIESLRIDTHYAGTGGGTGPGTIAAMEGRACQHGNAARRAPLQRTDANTAADRFYGSTSVARPKIPNAVCAASALH
jgi:hypothetical protein